MLASKQARTMTRAAQRAPTNAPAVEARFGTRPTLAERIEKLEATARQGEQIADLTSCDERPPMLGRARDRDGPLEHPHEKAAAVADADILADLLATVIELRDDQAELREIVANLSKQIFRPLSRRPPAGWGTLKQAAGLTGYSSERIRQWAVADKKLGRRLGGGWIVKLDRLPTRDAERN